MLKNATGHKAVVSHNRGRKDPSTVKKLYLRHDGHPKEEGYSEGEVFVFVSVGGERVYVIVVGEFLNSHQTRKQVRE